MRTVVVCAEHAHPFIRLDESGNACLGAEQNHAEFLSETKNY